MSAEPTGDEEGGQLLAENESTAAAAAAGSASSADTTGGDSLVVGEDNGDVIVAPDQRTGAEVELQIREKTEVSSASVTPAKASSAAAMMTQPVNGAVQHKPSAAIGSDSDSDDSSMSDDGGADDEKYDRLSRTESMTSKVKKFSSWECVTWILFLIFFWIMVTLGRTNGDLNFTQSAATRHKFLTSITYDPEYGAGEKTFEDMSSFNDFYNYLEVFMQVAMKETLDNGDEISDSDLQFYPLSRSRLLGGVRVRQTRLETKECSEEEDKFPICYDLGSDAEGTLNKGVDNVTFPEFKIKFQSASDLDDQIWRGKFDTYSGGGYVVDFRLDRNQSLELVNEMRRVNWFDESTSLIVIDFALYNPTSHLHTISRIALEIKSGGLFGNYEIKTWLFDRFATSVTGWYITCIAIVMAFILWFTVLMGREMYEDGCSCEKDKGYWGKTKWRYLDFINLLMFYTWIIVFAVNVSASDTDDLYALNEYKSLRNLQYMYLFEVGLLSGNGFLSFVKIFKYFSANARLRFFFTMMGRAATDIGLFVLVLCVWFIAFGVFGFLTFSSDIDDFRSPFFAFFNMMRFVVSDLPYEDLANSSRSVGSAYYVIWSLLMALILANVFIALLSEAYAEVREDLKGREEGGLFRGLFQRRLNIVGGYLRNFGLNLNVADVDADGDGQVSIKELMDQTGWDEEKATSFMMKFDKDKNGQLSQDEWKQMQSHVEKFEKEWAARQLREQRQKKKITEKEEELLLEQMRHPGIGSVGGAASAVPGYDGSYSIANSAAFEMAASQAVSGSGAAPISLAQKAEFERLKDELHFLEDMLRVVIQNQDDGEVTLAKLEKKQRSRNKRRIQMLKKKGSVRGADLIDPSMGQSSGDLTGASSAAGSPST